MQSIQREAYLEPKIEVVEMMVEYGFVGSQLEEIDGEKPEGEW